MCCGHFSASALGFLEQEDQRSAQQAHNHQISEIVDVRPVRRLLLQGLIQQTVGLIMSRWSAPLQR
jgi:hypothetical protein